MSISFRKHVQYLCMIQVDWYKNYITCYIDFETGLQCIIQTPAYTDNSCVTCVNQLPFLNVNKIVIQYRAIPENHVQGGEPANIFCCDWVVGVAKKSCTLYPCAIFSGTAHRNSFQQTYILFKWNMKLERVQNLQQLGDYIVFTADQWEHDLVCMLTGGRFLTISKGTKLYP